jgi:hypothetical protein
MMPAIWDAAGLLRSPSRRKNMAKKTTCPIGRHEFREKAKSVTVTINGIPLQAEVKEFSTGSLGWYLNGKTMIDVGGTPVSVQIGLNLTIVGSKELPQDQPANGQAVPA